MSNKPSAKKTDAVWSPIVKIVAIVCAVVLISAIVLAVVAKSGVIRRNTVVMEIGEEKVNAIEFNYHYYTALNDFYSQNYSYLNYLGFDATSSLKSQPCYFDTGITWHDYFVNMAESYATEVYLLSAAAISENFEMTQESKDSLEETVAELTATAESNKMSVNEYLSSVYGKNMTLESFREYATRRLLAADYYEKYVDALEYSDEDISKHYEDNKNKYDRVDYYAYKVKANADSGKTEEQIANEIKGASSDKDAFLAAVKAIEGDTFKAETYLREDSSYISEDETSEWLFDASRVSGDVTIISSTTGEGEAAKTSYTVVFFLERAREDYKLATMRHILIKSEDTKKDDSATVEDLAKVEAEDLLKKWQEGAKTQDSFTALVAENTDDTASAETGGLYENFAQGDMVSEIEDWIWADGRTPGDCEIVKTTYGYHLVYFVEYGEAKWKSDIISEFKDEDYGEYLDNLKENTSIVFNDNNLSLIG